MSWIGLAIAALASAGCVSARTDSSAGADRSVSEVAADAGPMSIDALPDLGWDTPYFAGIQVATGTDAERATVTGRVFHDENGNGIVDAGEAGIANVLVSNGLDVVRTDTAGRYELPARDDRLLQGQSHS